MILRHIIFGITIGFACTLISLLFGLSLVKAFLVYIVSGAFGILLSALISYR